MGYLSLLPDHLSVFESWIARIFLLLGLLTMGPWALILLYDVLLYIFRSVCYELPVVGGRAKGASKPSPPRLESRPGGHRRQFSLVSLGTPSSSPRKKKRRGLDSDSSSEDEALRRRVVGARGAEGSPTPVGRGDG